jgi:hypothetical protein
LSFRRFFTEMPAYQGLKIHSRVETSVS